ncbi:hypothetical protein VOLCADRAFT_105349 [Volvox carteri f. nagariensis]|uniref:SAP30-binding protein n=1 Tax=Volvox carteri f. nagariensis TaxID=3068 RepID=D8U0A9_VOLCA|nr:uncharacterized protein VOLCADRAFT_105349 [Volvox carteri f. nagariensis]EFJ46830.1 hypothetical protein VOLCADRAFT_105349 [Volvox carteri f. nagariensis]|eukprot:XP_002952039.1 hypothetical protein VOLCADRAFT_105349 [Volvox carteri f. nagariensis]
MKRKDAAVGALGLGGYASDDEDDDYSQEPGPEDNTEDQSNGDHGPGVLLPNYRSRESLDLNGLEDEALAEERRRSPETAETSGADGGGDEGYGTGRLDPDNPLNRLPPELRDPLPTTCPEELQARFSQYLDKLRSKGISLTDSITHRKDFRNPDFLQKLVDHFHVQEHGSAFPPDVFDPDSLPPEDIIDQLIKALEREQERRARLREQQSAAGTARIDFTKATGQFGHIPASNSATNLAMAQQAAAFAQAAVARVVGSKR